MDNTRIHKVCFLFGAGCEGKGQFELVSGAKFISELLFLPKWVENLFGCLNPEKNNAQDAGFIWPRTLLGANSHSVLKETVLEAELDLEYAAKCKELGFLCPDSKAIENYLKNETKRKKESTDRTKRRDSAFSKAYQKYIYWPLKYYNNRKKAPKDTKFKFLEKSASELRYFGWFDSLCNYLRKPGLYPKEVGKVLAVYYNAMAVIVKGLLAGKTDDEKNKWLSDLTRNNFSASISEKVRELSRKNPGSSYYGIIRDLFKTEENDSVRIITTNYSRLAEYSVFNQESENRIAYLHGRLDMFESLKTLDVKPIEDFSSNDVIFPFLLVRSGVKPIVSPWQMAQYEKAELFLQECNVLIVLGFGINSDDYHIISMIRDYLNKGGHVVALVYFKDESLKNRVCRYFSEYNLDKFVALSYEPNQFRDICQRIKESESFEKIQWDGCEIINGTKEELEA